MYGGCQLSSYRSRRHRWRAPETTYADGSVAKGWISLVKTSDRCQTRSEVEPRGVGGQMSGRRSLLSSLDEKTFN